MLSGPLTQAPNVTPLPERSIRCLSLRRIDKGVLLAFCDLKINAWHLVLHDCKWFMKGANEWIGLPSTSWTDRQGKTVYKNLIEFDDKEAGERFNRAALDAVKAYRGP